MVFIVGMEDGILPHFRSFDDPVQMEEERRLCYVGITRAKQKVYLVRAFRRSLMGSSGATKPSRFLEDIPRNLIADAEWWQGDETLAAATVYSWDRPPAIDIVDMVIPELKAGDHVYHAQFGDGVVVSCHPVKNDSEVVVAFKGGGVKKLLLSFAQLEKVE